MMYKGNWKDGEMDGEGVIINKEGAIFNGKFSKGQTVEMKFV